MVLKVRTPVGLKFTRTIASSPVIAGEKVDLHVTAEERIADLIVISKDSVAAADVPVTQAKRTMARGG